MDKQTALLDADDPVSQLHKVAKWCCICNKTATKNAGIYAGPVQGNSDFGIKKNYLWKPKHFLISGIRNP